METVKVKRLVSETKEYNVSIRQDPYPDPPREWDNLGTILYTNNLRYVLGDKVATPEEMQAIYKDRTMLALPVYAYIHGSVSLSTSPYGCPWDSGQCGIIYVSKEQICKEWKVKRLSKKIIDVVLNNLKIEVETYNKYINGEVYGFEVTDQTGDVVDSCYGFYSVEDALQAAKENLPGKETV